MNQVMSHQSANLCAGTQVIAVVPVHGTNNTLVHLPGTVGVVMRTPAMAGEKFFVRFPDGLEASLNRDQLDVLELNLFNP